MVFQESFEWYIALYLFLGGVGAGAILSAAFADLYDREKYVNYIKSASLIGMPAVAIGCFFLLIDLGQGLTKPWLLIYLFANPTSAITWGTAILTLFIIVSLLYAAYNFNFIKFGGGKITLLSLIVLAIGTAGYTGVLLGVLRAIPFWHQTLIPVLFIISAISTGISATVVVKEILFRKKIENIAPIETGHFYLMVLEFMMVVAMIIIALNGVPEMVFSMKVLLSGKYAVQFWLIFMILGLLLPTLLYGLQEIKKLHMKGSFLIIIELLVLLGGYYLRYLILHAGVFTEKFAHYIG